jgi:hypothetical protein
MKKTSLLLTASLIASSLSASSEKKDMLAGEVESLYSTIKMEDIAAEFCSSGKEINQTTAAEYMKQSLFEVYKTLNPDPTWFEMVWQYAGPSSLSMGASLLGPLLASRVTNNQMIQAQFFSVFNPAVQYLVAYIAPKDRLFTFPFEEIFSAINDFDIETAFMVGVCRGAIGQGPAKWLAQDLGSMRHMGQPTLKEFRDSLNIFLSVPTEKTKARDLLSVTSKEISNATDHLHFKASTLSVRDMVRYILADQKYTKDPMRPIFALVGPGGVGKTWFVEKILPQLTGLPMCVVNGNIFSSEAGLFGSATVPSRRTQGSPGAILECMIRTDSLNFILLLNEADLMIRTDQESFQRALNFFDSGKNSFYSPYLERDLPYESIPVVLTSNSADFTGKLVTEASRDAFATRLSGILQVDYPQQAQVSAHLLKLAKAHEASSKLSDLALQNIVDVLSKQYCGEQAAAPGECNYRSLTRLLKQRLILATEPLDETCEDEACGGE